MNQFLIERFQEATAKTALIFEDQEFSFDWLLSSTKRWQRVLDSEGVKTSDVVAYSSSYSPQSVAFVLANILYGTILAPLTPFTKVKHQDYIQIAAADFFFSLESHSGDYTVESREASLHPLIARYPNLGAGLILFSSGSTGEPKGVLHSWDRLLKKFEKRRLDLSTIGFLLPDHIGGVDTLFYCLSNTSRLLIGLERSPERICEAIEKHRIEVLPTTPSFLNLLLISGLVEKYDMSSLKYITYGAEMMPQGLLHRCNEFLPEVEFLQKFGTSETGALRTKSEDSNSLWVSIGGDGFDTRIVDGILQIKAQSSMLGYLNAPDPFTEDGWFITGDKVEEKDGYYRFLGRDKDVVNVGGEKVFPAEVEEVIQSHLDVIHAIVFGEQNPMIGNIVCARVQVADADARDDQELILALKKHCQEALEPFKVPMKITLTTEELISSRFKKLRR